MTGALSQRPGMMCQFLNSPLKPLEMLPLLQKQSTDINANSSMVHRYVKFRETEAKAQRDTPHPTKRHTLRS